MTDLPEGPSLERLPDSRFRLGCPGCGGHLVLNPDRAYVPQVRRFIGEHPDCFVPLT